MSPISPANEVTVRRRTAGETRKREGAVGVLFSIFVCVSDTLLPNAESGLYKFSGDSKGCFGKELYEPESNGNSA